MQKIKLLKTHKHQLQAIRFKRSKYTPQSARKYIKDNNISQFPKLKAADDWLAYELQPHVFGSPYYVRKIKRNNIQLVYQIIDLYK